MKSLFPYAVFILLICVVSPVLAENITIDGTTYERIRWGKSTAAHVTMYHRKGVTKLELETLPEFLQERFDYDPQAAAEYRREVEEEKKRADERKKYYELTDDDDELSDMPEIDTDRNLFYLKKFKGDRLFGPFDCKVGTIVSVGNGTFKIARVSGKLFTIESIKTKDSMGPFWLKDYSDVSLDGISFRLLRPSTVQKEVSKVRDEKKKVTEKLDEMMAGQEAVKLQTATGLQGSRVTANKGLSVKTKNSQFKGLKKNKSF